MKGLVRLLGIGTPEGAAAIRLALGRVGSHGLVQHEAAGFVAFAQQEPAGPRRGLGEAARLQGLLVVQKRLEAACRVAPFLPANPAAALCPAAELPELLEAAADGLGAALERDGATHQWQVTLRWPVEHWLVSHRPRLMAAQASGELRDSTALAAAIAQAMVDEAAQRAARLEAALAPAVLRLARLPAGAETELSFVLLVPRAREEIIEQALQALPADLSAGGSAELRGPMPPVNFAAWQVAEAEEPALRAAWALLGLPERVDAEVLRLRWRDRAANLHPDRTLAPGDGGAMAEMRGAYRLLAPLLDAGKDTDLTALLPRARRRLVPCGEVAA